MTAQKRSVLTAIAVLVLSLFTGAGAASAGTLDVSPPGANDWG